MNATASTTHYRGRFSLLIGPWHNSSRLAAGLAAVFLAICNFPGQYIERVVLEYDPFWPYDFTGRFEHGWPLTIVDRYPPFDFDDFGSVAECWRFWQGDQGDLQVKWTSLLINTLAILLIALAGGALWEFRRRRRRRLLQFHTLDMLGLMAALSCCGAWYVAERQEFVREKALLESGPAQTLIDPGGRPFTEHEISVAKWNSGGITWLRRLCGDSWFEFLDRPYHVDAVTTALPSAACLSEVGILQLRSDITTDELLILEEFPRLEIVEFTFSRVRDRNGDVASVIELPMLPKLRALNLGDPFDPRGVIRGLGRLKCLEAVKLDNCNLDADAMRELGSLTQLRFLSIANARVADDGWGHLHRLSNLHHLVVSRTELGEESLQTIGRQTELRQLELCQTAPRSGALGHLRQLTKLEALNLAGCKVTFDDVAEVLDLRDIPLTVEQRELLSEWFPNCEFR